VLADVVNRADVGMIQRRRGARFTLKALAGLGILSEIFGKKLQCNAASEALIFRLVYNTHSATAKLGYDAVMGNYLVQHWRLW